MDDLERRLQLLMPPQETLQNIRDSSLERRLNELRGRRDFDITDYFADPRNVKSGSYTDLDDLRNILLEDVKIDVNAYINKI